MTDIVDEITAKQAKFVAALISGKNILDASKVADISEKTAHRWLKLDSVRTPYLEATQAIVESAMLAAMADFGKGHAVLVEIAEDSLSSPTVRALAARAITVNALKIYELKAKMTKEVQRESLEDLSVEQLLLLDQAAKLGRHG